MTCKYIEWHNIHVPGFRLGEYRTRWTFYWLSPHEFSGGFKEKKEEIAQNHIAMFSTRFYHILTCIYTVFSHDKAHILKFRTLAFFHKRNF